ncbi:MAG: HAMP domain-containing histidine kinase [Oscillospiraceae bacterium]|nr:HAMP domain-containing histidine kinase [Oscillospiraceae bacterium]
MRLHIWIWFMVFVVAVFVLLWVSQILFLQNSYDRMTASEVQRQANRITEAYRRGDAEEFRATCDDIAFSSNICITVYDSLQRPLIYSRDVLGINCVIHGWNNKSREIIRLLREEGNGVLCRKYPNPQTATDLLIYACTIGDTEKPEAYLLMNTPLVPAAMTVDILRRQLIIIMVILVLLACIISFIVSSRLAKPIARVTKEAEQLAHGRYDISFTGGGYDEANRLAETLTYASGEINRVDRMQRDLIANASHDLRTPLTMLKAYAEMIRDLSGDNPVKRNEHLGVIIEETDRLTALVNDILDLSKLENGRMKLDRTEFDMEQRLTEIVERYRGLSGVSGFRFTLETDGAARVCCDAGKIEQVICNLINNAMNYSGEDKQIFVTQKHTPQGVKISVRDTGEGMDQETLSRIFDKYYRSENYTRKVVGTGLGLSIVKAILRLHDYAFGVDSRVGEGSTFWFMIHDIVKDGETAPDSGEEKPDESTD